MNYGLTDDQTSILTGLEQLIEGSVGATPTTARHAHYNEELARAVLEAGYLAIAREPGFGILDAALIVERLARLPWVLEAAQSAIVSSVLQLEAGAGPIAVARGDGCAPVRFLPFARVLVLDRGENVWLVRVDPDRVQPVESLLAYPYGRLDSLDGLDYRVLDDAAPLRRRARIALAVEAAGCMAAALALVVEHVKTRHAFGRPLGSFQAIQHRLANAAEVAEAAKWLAFRAAWSDQEADAALAAAFAQGHIGSLTYDLHQFCGAMGLTLEFPLHLWTYRLRALVGELGGSTTQARAAALATWG